MKKVKYIGFYDSKDFQFEKRVRSIAAVNKMNYIASAIERAGYRVEIVSPSWSANIGGFYKKRTTILSENISLKIGPTFGADRFFSRKLRIFLSLFWLFFYLLRNVKKGEKIIVYHSVTAIYPVYYAQKIKKFKIVLELNEIYQDVTDFSPNIKRLEMMFIKNAESYILSTELLQSKISNEKLFLVNYGDYRISEKVDTSFEDKIHIVYAGIIDKNKAGAFNAVEAAQYLSSEYMIHIIGFGNDQDISDLNSLIKNVNTVNKCKVLYNGLKLGDDYIEYISKCQIGLSTQTLDGEYNNTSFPSKVLSYLGLGLRVVSVDIDAIKTSKIGNLLFYYKENSGRSISDAILKIDMNSKYNSKSTIEKLDKDFIKDLAEFIN